MKLQTKIASGMILLLVIAIALAVPLAVAQTAPPQTKNDVKPTVKDVTDIIRGEGAIVDKSGGLLKGHYVLALVSQSDNSGTEQYLVKNGQFIINNGDFSDQYKVVSASWTVTKSQSGYSANGDVTSGDGTTYKVSLDAKMLQGLKNGSLYEADGTFSDSSGQIYGLHYISVMVEKHSPLTGA